MHGFVIYMTTLNTIQRLNVCGKHSCSFSELRMENSKLDIMKFETTENHVGKGRHFQRSTNEAVADVKCKKNLLEPYSMLDRPVNTGACFPFCPASGRANIFLTALKMLFLEGLTTTNGA